jgi:hypothetical protein
MNIHIMPVGKTIGHVLTAFKEFKIDKLILISSHDCNDKVTEIKDKVGVFDVDIDIKIIDPFKQDSYAKIVDYILDCFTKNPDKTYYINITGGTNLMSSAALTAAHFIGANAYYVLKTETNGNIIEVPIVKISFSDALTDKQRQMLKTLHRETRDKGMIKNISDFASKYGDYKQKVLYHLSEFEKLNLIKIDRSSREHILRFTTTGELIIKMV